MPDVTVPDVTVAVVFGAVAVNRNRTVAVADVAVLSSVTSPTLYIEEDTTSRATTLSRIPVREGYQVMAVEDFTRARHDGGVSMFRQDRQSSQEIWKVRAKFIFKSAAEYAYSMNELMSGVPFETDLVIGSSPDPEDPLSGLPYICYPIPQSMTLNSVEHDGYEVSIEFFATEV